MIRSEGCGCASSGDDYYGRCELHGDRAMILVSIEVKQKLCNDPMNDG